eukprot:TRINITY_DN4673_c0_g1_i1.p1 TRINITY_DN4673_c0_g1~~TRINITY_DN4673_c0_g1_i1.p1  ORF type:complete len:276 (-),score=48.81 TRINITY_DN4673_c0_g1_i1:4-831(-)
MSRIDFYLKPDESSSNAPQVSGWNRAQPNSYYSLPLRTPVGVDALSPESDAVVPKKELKPPVAPIGTSPELERGMYFEATSEFNPSYSPAQTSVESSPRFLPQWSMNHHDYGGSLPNLPDFHTVDQNNTAGSKSSHHGGQSANLSQHYQNNYLLAQSYQSESLMFDFQEMTQQRRRTISWDTGDKNPPIPTRIFDLFSSPQSSEQYSYLVQAISPKNPAGHLYQDSQTRYRSTGSLDESDPFQQSFESLTIEDQQWSMSPPPVSHFPPKSSRTLR